jgi:hypothetical protein
MMRNRLIALPLALLLGLQVSANAQSSNEKVLNLYSARHYQTDEALVFELHQIDWDQD